MSHFVTEIANLSSGDLFKFVDKENKPYGSVYQALEECNQYGELDVIDYETGAPNLAYIGFNCVKVERGQNADSNCTL